MADSGTKAALYGTALAPRCVCGQIFEPRPPGSPGPADRCRSCARLCRACGVWFETTPKERRAAVVAQKERPKEPAALPDLCRKCRPARKAKAPVASAVAVAQISERRSRLG